MNASKKVIALLPVKAHSSRVPEKNFREFHGKPLTHWILDTLLSINRIDAVVINTDARNELASIGVVDGERVLIRDRRPEICGDEVSMNLILRDDLEACEADIYLMTHSTNPLLGKATIEAALDAFIAALSEGSADSLFTVNRHQARFYRKDMRPVNHDPDDLIPTQDLEPWFEENSNLYLFSRESFRATSARIGALPMMFVTPGIESIDIDTEDNWTLAEAVARTTHPTVSQSPARESNSS